MDLFSSKLKAFNGSIINAQLASTLFELKALGQGEPLTVLEWDADHIAVAITISVTLPSLGNFNAIDIHENEPIIIIFNLAKYPWKAPLAFPDRIDFPKEKLSHLYIAVEDNPPAFCLIRDGFGEWYANKTIRDMVIRIQNWYRDAAAGVLNEDGNQFEPFRLEGYNGSLIFDYDVLAEIIANSSINLPGRNFALLLFEYFGTEKGDSGWKFLKQVSDENFDEVKKQVQEETEKPIEEKGRKLLFYGFVIWSENGTVIDHYSIEIPKTWKEFIVFCKSYDIELGALEKYIVSFQEHKYKAIPLITAIKRPKPIIGYSSSMELLNFSLYIDDGQKDGEVINAEASISLKQHKQPITKRKAAEISGFCGNIPSLSIMAGCGALGARVGMHLVKSGTGNLLVCDIDKLVPHNFIRHPITSYFGDVSKAGAFATEMNKVVSDSTITNTGKLANEVIDIISKVDDDLHILDFTASENFQNYLINHTGIAKSWICSASITDFGDLGVVYFEGKGRNPRLDDLQVLLFNSARTNKRIGEWVAHEAERAEKTQSIKVGVGCNSETTILSEDIVAGHASFISGNIKQQSMLSQPRSGRIFLNSLIHEPHFQFNSMSFEFAPLEIVQMENNPSWQLRITKEVADKIRILTAKADPVETGGVLIGRANYKTNTIHVVDVIDAPPDSQATEACFHRGITGLPEQINDIARETGGQIGYIGEWHSHPQGPEGWSAKDVSTLKRFRAEYDSLTTRFPAFMLIATGHRFIPYLL